MSWVDDPTLALAVRERLMERFDKAKWTVGDMDGEPTLDADIGQVGITIYTEREPVEWSVTLIALDGTTPPNAFTSKGDALSIESAKVVAMSYAMPLLDKAVRFLVGDEVDFSQ
jgi:hypothetical protein